MQAYAGPSSARATEVTDMYAKSVQGERPEDAVKCAAQELRKIYT